MRLLCNNSELELTTSSQLSFKKQNPLFAFENMSCERTVSFAIPATPKNDAILSLSRNVAWSGEGMRRKFPAELYDGLIKKTGYIYVSSYKDGEYSAIFVSGELVGLQKLKDAGNIDEILDGYFEDVTCVYGDTPVRPCEEPFGTYPYISNTIVRPAVDARSLLGAIQSATGVRVAQSLPEDVGDKKLIITDVKPFQEIVATYTAEHYSGTGEAAENDGYAQYGTQHNLVLQSSISSYYDWLVSHESVSQEWVDASGKKLYGYPTVLTALTTLAITFPSDFPENYYLIADPRVNDYMTFLGDYSFTKLYSVVTRYGEPLAGRTVTIEKGQTFLVVSDEHYNYSYNAMRWKFTDALEPQEIIISGGKEVSVGDTIVMSNNLPECSVMELLNTLAACTGKVLNFENNQVKFESMSLAAFSTIDITGKILKYQEVRRSFGDYKQNNWIKTIQSEWIKHPQTYARYKYVTANYQVDNDNLDKTNELLTIPFSEGAGNNSGQLFVEYPTTDESGEELDGEDKIVIANYYEAGAEYIDPSWPEDWEEWTDEMWEIYFKYYNHSARLTRISLPINATIKSLCDISTSISVVASMTLYEYEQITPKCKILLDGQLYVWTEANWSKNQVTLKLSKVA